MTPIGASGFFYHTLQLSEPARLEYKFMVDGEWQLDPFCPNQVDNGLGESNSYFNGGEYLERAKMANVLDNLIAAGQIPALVAVMVDPVNRMEEYWANDRYLEFLCGELLPEIEERYRTASDRKARGVMGASLGGLISVYAALSRPDLFSLVAGQSSALMTEEQKLASMVQSTRRASFRFYFDVGKYEPRFIPAHEKLVALLNKKRWPTLYQELPGGHNWTSWRAHLKDLLVFLWKTPRRQRPVPRRRRGK